MRRKILTHVTAFTCVPSLLVVQPPRAGGFVLLVIKAPPSTLPARSLSHLTYASGVWDQRSEWKITAGRIGGSRVTHPSRGALHRVPRCSPGTLRSAGLQGTPCEAAGGSSHLLGGVLPLLVTSLASFPHLHCWRRQVQSPPLGESLLPGENKAPSPKEGDLCWF